MAERSDERPRARSRAAQTGGTTAERSLRARARRTAGSGRTTAKRSRSRSDRLVCARPSESPRASHGGTLRRLWRWLLAQLRRLVRRLKRLLSRSPRMRRRVIAALVARQLPRPFSMLARGIADPDQRGFGFRWLSVTLGVALSIGLLVALVVALPAGLLALLAVGTWTLAKNVLGQGRRPTHSRPAHA